MSRKVACAVASLATLGACAAPRTPSPAAKDVASGARQAETERLALVSDAIVVCGRRFRIGAPVVLWDDPRGYDAYSSAPRFPGELGAEPPPAGLRYRPGREAIARASGELDLDELQQIVDLFVIHYDACGTSRRCFQVLHDRRGLSVHFLLDVDGTLYQTLDLAETAWHARQANPRSIGIEIANVGAFAPGVPSPLDEWYARDERGARLKLPDDEQRAGEQSGLRARDFVGRPARSERVRGTVQGLELEMHDFTPEQYDTLVRLTAALCEIFPRLEPDAPRDAGGRVRTDALPPEELEAFHGILGHLHVTQDKVDPGPAFDWERTLSEVRALLERRELARAP